MNVLLTGASGFIGSYLLRRLLESTDTSHIVAVCHSDASVLRLRMAYPILPERLTIVSRREYTSDPLSHALPDVAVILGSASTNKPYLGLDKCVFENSYTQLHFIKQLATFVRSRIITAGTYYEYGLSANDFSFIPVDAPLLPFDEYSASKALFYSSLFSALHSGHFSGSCCSFLHLRLSQVYGPGELSSRLVATVLDHANSNRSLHLPALTSIRDFTHVDIVVDALMNSIEAAPASFLSVENITAGKPMIIREFLQDLWLSQDTDAELTFDPDVQGCDPLMLSRFVPLKHALDIIE